MRGEGSRAANRPPNRATIARATPVIPVSTPFCMSWRARQQRGRARASLHRATRPCRRGILGVVRGIRRPFLGVLCLLAGCGAGPDRRVDAGGNADGGAPDAGVYADAGDASCEPADWGSGYIGEEERAYRPLTTWCGVGCEAAACPAGLECTSDRIPLSGRMYCAEPVCEDPDHDADGHLARPCGGSDCDDADLDWNPDAADSLGDDQDENCDCADGVDRDLDRVASIASGGADCDDGDLRIHPGAPGDSWTSEPVDWRSRDGWPSAAYDRDGALHVVYELGDTLTHAVRREGGWRNHAIASEGEFHSFGSPALAIGRDGTLHVTYVDAEDRREAPVLFHASLPSCRCADCVWDVERMQDPELDAAESAGSSGIAVDADGVVHVVYAFGGEVRHATRLDDGWRMEVVGPTGSGGLSLAIDADGRLHLYLGEVYATNASGDWRSETIVSALRGTNGAVVVDPLGLVHVVYSASMPDGPPYYEVRHAWGRFGDWRSEHVVDERWSPSELALAVDSSGVLHLATAGQPKTPEYATRDAAGWRFEPVDVAPASFPAVAVAPDDALSVCFLQVILRGELAWDTSLHCAGRAVPDGVDFDCDGAD